MLRSGIPTDADLESFKDARRDTKFLPVYPHGRRVMTTKRRIETLKYARKYFARTPQVLDNVEAILKLYLEDGLEYGTIVWAQGGKIFNKEPAPCAGTTIWKEVSSKTHDEKVSH